MFIPPQPRQFYTNKIINNLTEYDNFAYSFDYITIITVITIIYSIPSLLVTLKMCQVARAFPGPKIRAHGLHPMVLRLFLLMQISNFGYFFSDFLLIRLPSTTVITGSCGKLGNLEFLMGAQFLTYYLSTFATLIFCLARFFIVFSPRNHDFWLDAVIWRGTVPAACVAAGVAAFWVTIGGEGICVQLDEPYQFGAIVINCTKVYKNNFTTIAHISVSTFAIFLIVALSTYMLLKLRGGSKLAAAHSASDRSVRRRKAEKVLTVTMVLICVPLVLSLSMRALDILRSPYYAYVMIARPLFVDTRVNLVSWFFYLTHPIFKNAAITVTSVKSTTT
ncbi:unnamed protein product [Caenorhabditis angaria]|uniref:Uncharacterized protein n=1 Tax=Caenorhabditis angaria TaxID=860376 RepID=A0A9P1IQ49_9PELO|nr:unnamed protein product [Caenorhabditis angaria]